MNPSGFHPIGFAAQSGGQDENNRNSSQQQTVAAPAQWQYFPARHQNHPGNVQAPPQVTYVRSTSCTQYSGAPIVNQHNHGEDQKQNMYRGQNLGAMMPPTSPALGGGSVSQPLQAQYYQGGYSAYGQGTPVERVVVPQRFYSNGGSGGGVRTDINYTSGPHHHPTPRGGVASRVRRYPSGCVGSSASSVGVTATGNVRSHEPVSAVYGAYRQYDASSGNSFTYANQTSTSFKATTGAMRSTAVILLMGAYSEELCISAKQAILMVPGVLAVTTQQVTWARKQKAYATVSLVRGLNSAMQSALLRSLEEAGIQGLVIAEDTLKELIMSSANDGSSSSRNQEQSISGGGGGHHDAIIEAAATIPEGTVSAAVASRQAAMREYSERGVSTDSVGSGGRRRSLAESHALLGDETPEGGVERAKEALQHELPHICDDGDDNSVKHSVEGENDKENDGSDNNSSIPEIECAKIEPSPTLPSYDCQWVPLSDLPLGEGGEPSIRRQEYDVSPSSPAYIDTEDQAKSAVGRWLSESLDRLSEADDDDDFSYHRKSSASSSSLCDEDDADYLDEHGDPTKQNTNAQMQFFNQAAMSFGYTKALGMHEKFAGIVTLHENEENGSESKRKEEEKEQQQPDTNHYYGGSWFGGWLGGN